MFINGEDEVKINKIIKSSRRRRIGIIFSAT